MIDRLISVVIPAYHCEATITRAIDSALAQGVPLEVIVVSDGDHGVLAPVMDRYRENPAVVYVKNEQNMGAAESRNRGVTLAKGRYIAFLDADDYWAPGKLQKQLQALENSGAVLCCTAREMMRPDGTSTGRVIGVRDTITYRELLKHNSISCSSVLLRREAALEFPMEHADSHEDYILWLRLLQKYGWAVGINEPLLKYTASDTGKSGSKLHSAKMTFRVYRYMGFHPVVSVGLFCSYALHGVWKHFIKK